MPERFACFFLVLCFFTNSSTSAQNMRFQFMQPKMGSPFHLIFYAHDSLQANLLAQETFEYIDSMNVIFSDYLPSSELNQLSATAGTKRFVPVSPLLYRILLVSQEAGTKSWNTFDITIGPLSKLWRIARKQGKFPADKEIQDARKLVGLHKLVIDTLTKRIALLMDGMQLDLGGIAKGFVAQEAVNFLQSKGISSTMADAGGDIVCSAPPPGKKGWLIGINAPGQTEKLLQATLEIGNKSVATSGDVYQFMEWDGKKYSHIIDPGTGYGVTFQRNVTIIANDGATADWLATACSILPLQKAKKLVRKNDAHLLISRKKGACLKLYATQKMKRYLKGKVR